MSPRPQQVPWRNLNVLAVQVYPSNTRPHSTFDEQAIPDLKSEAIDFRAASEFFAPHRQLTTQAWSTLRVTTEHQGRQVPTIGGLLLFGKDRFARFPDAWIRPAALRESIERAYSTRRRFAHSCLALRKRRSHSSTST